MSDFRLSGHSLLSNVRIPGFPDQSLVSKKFVTRVTLVRYARDTRITVFTTEAEF